MHATFIGHSFNIHAVLNNEHAYNDTCVLYNIPVIFV